MGLPIILVGALVALIAAWFVNSIVALLSGERPSSLLRTWWDIFSRLVEGRVPMLNLCQMF
jgi:hypothetical protein